MTFHMNIRWLGNSVREKLGVWDDKSIQDADVFEAIFATRYELEEVFTDLGRPANTQSTVTATVDLETGRILSITDPGPAGTISFIAPYDWLEVQKSFDSQFYPAVWGGQFTWRPTRYWFQQYGQAMFLLPMTGGTGTESVSIRVTRRDPPVISADTPVSDVTDWFMYNESMLQCSGELTSYILNLACARLAATCGKDPRPYIGAAESVKKRLREQIASLQANIRRVKGGMQAS